MVVARVKKKNVKIREMLGFGMNQVKDCKRENRRRHRQVQEEHQLREHQQEQKTPEAVTQEDCKLKKRI